MEDSLYLRANAVEFNRLQLMSFPRAFKQRRDR
jgi:hypothetical protein